MSRTAGCRRRWRVRRQFTDISKFLQDPADGKIRFRGLGRGRRFSGQIGLEGVARIHVRALPADVCVFALIASMFGAGQVRHRSIAEDNSRQDLAPLKPRVPLSMVGQRYQPTGNGFRKQAIKYSVAPCEPAAKGFGDPMAQEDKYLVLVQKR